MVRPAASAFGNGEIMSRYAIVRAGVVVNVAVAAEPLSAEWIQSDTARKGDLYDAQSGQFTTPAEPVQARPVSLYQLKVALDDAGLLDQADAYVATLPRRAQLFWQYGAEVEPTRSMAANLATALSLTNQQMRAIFLQAMTVQD